MSYAVLSDFPAPAFRPRRYVQPRRRRGMGASAAQIAGSATSTALESAGGILMMIPGLQLPGAIVAAVGAITGPIISMFNGCGATCTQATQYANQAEVALQQVVATYMAAPVHYASAQSGTLAHVQSVFDALRQACSNPALGSAGQRCISERLTRGAPAPWCNLPNNVGCDWVTRYYDPIANDPSVVPDPSPLGAVGSTVSSAFNSLFGASTAAGSGSILPLVMIGGVALLLLAVLL